jgi:pimeloyl-ACP methyl ester carboxylesterase
MGECLAKVNGIELCYETIGDPSGRPLLLIMGLGGPLIWWDDGLCDLLVRHGFFVIRYDNRDCGLSTIMKDVAPPAPLKALLGDKNAASYTLDDLAADAASLLGHLELPSAHVMGISMGGMIGQTLAIREPERVLSLTSIMSTTGSRRVGWPKPRALPLLLRRAPRSRDGYIEHALGIWRVIGSPGFPLDEERIRARAGATYDRGIDPRGTARQLVAITASGDRTALLKGVTAPTLVIHGADDPLVHPSGGTATARAIPDAQLMVIRGMGHDLPPVLWPRVVNAVDRNAKRAKSDVSIAAG